MKYAIIAASLLVTTPAWAGSTIPTFDAGRYDNPYQPPSYDNPYQRRIDDPPRYDDEYFRSRGSMGPSIGDRFGNHLGSQSGW